LAAPADGLKHVSRKNKKMTHVVIVIPCYNEALRLDARRFLRFASRYPRIRFVMVDDASTDNTIDVLRSMEARNPGQFDVLPLASNGGKAEAVRKGLLHGFSQNPLAVGFWDADLATPLEAIPEMLQVIDRDRSINLVFGSRMPLLGRQIKRKPWRKKMGWLFATVASNVLGLNIHDTQCGAKLFRVNPIMEQVFADPFSSGWIFDVELFARWICLDGRDNPDSAYEFPLAQWQDIDGSKLRVKDYINAVAQLGSIWWRYRMSEWSPSSPYTVVLPMAPTSKAA